MCCPTAPVERFMALRKLDAAELALLVLPCGKPNVAQTVLALFPVFSNPRSKSPFGQHIYFLLHYLFGKSHLLASSFVVIFFIITPNVLPSLCILGILHLILSLLRTLGFGSLSIRLMIILTFNIIRLFGLHLKPML